MARAWSRLPRVPAGRVLLAVFLGGAAGAVARGALTTFSALQVELVVLLDAGHAALAGATRRRRWGRGLVALAAGRRLA
jgi:fluoride ion exporter CrcB/FEX